LDVENSAKSVTEKRRTSKFQQSPQWFEKEVFILEEDEPANYKEALVGPSSNEWLKVMKSEI
jgi:hypothetical protein